MTQLETDSFLGEGVFYHLNAKEGWNDIVQKGSGGQFIFTNDAKIVPEFIVGLFLRQISSRLLLT